MIMLTDKNIHIPFKVPLAMNSTNLNNCPTSVLSIASSGLGIRELNKLNCSSNLYFHIPILSFFLHGLLFSCSSLRFLNLPTILFKSFFQLFLLSLLFLKINTNMRIHVQQLQQIYQNTQTTNHQYYLPRNLHRNFNQSLKKNERRTMITQVQ